MEDAEGEEKKEDGEEDGGDGKVDCKSELERIKGAISA